MKKNGGRVARGEVARDDGLEHSRRVEEAQEEGVDPEEETQHGDRPLRSRADAEVSEWKGSRTRGLFSFPRKNVQKKSLKILVRVNRKRGWVANRRSRRIWRYFCFVGSYSGHFAPT